MISPMSDAEHLSHIRHSLAHLLAAAVLELYPDTKLTLGPAIDTGFYYDFDFGESPLIKGALPSPACAEASAGRSAGGMFTTPALADSGTPFVKGNKKAQVSETDLPKIEQKMREILKTWKTFEGKEVAPAEARKVCKGNPYKLELIDGIEEKGEKMTLYTSGTFTDLCRGGHTEDAKEMRSAGWKLDRIAGAYWRGDEKNKMLTRIYGLAFATKEELEAYEKQREEAAKRDHKKLGKELDLFTFSDLVGAGLPLFTPRGTIIRDALRERLLSISKKYGMLPVTIPHLAKRRLYEISGHADKFGDELIKVVSRYDEFVMKPVNCPHHTQIYASRPRSYRDLPLRYMESTMQYRDEKPGEIGGLTRVRAITVDDGHIFCRVDQIKDEAKNIAKIIEEFYTAVGLFGKHWVSLSVRDPEHPEKYIGTEEGWKNAEAMLKEISDELSLNAERREGEAALYGPKLDYMFKDSLGREWQLATIQIDFAMPARFKLEYSGQDGAKQTPVMIHHAILGSYERFMAILIEHYAGAFPLWLSPVQVKILPVGEKFMEYAKTVHAQLQAADIRSELDTSNETLGKKVRGAKVEKVPYWIVVGEKEMTDRTVTLENRTGNKSTFLIAQTISHLQTEIKGKK